MECVTVSRPVNKWPAITLTHALTYKYLFRLAIEANAKLYMVG